MIIDSSENLQPKELIDALIPGTAAGGFLVAQFDSDRKVLRTKVPPERAGWFLQQVPTSKHLSISSASFFGKAILPNFASTNTLSVNLTLVDSRKFATPRKLLNSICEHLRDRQIPLPSVLICKPGSAMVLWITDRYFDYLELGEAHTAECGLRAILEPFGSTETPQYSARYVALPGSSRPIALIANGAISTCSAKRLLELAYEYVKASSANRYKRHIEVISELGALRFKRAVDFVSTAEQHWVWMAAYAASAGLLVPYKEVREISRAIAESLENKEWDGIRTHVASPLTISYENYLDVLVRNIKDGEVKINDGDYYPVSGDAWVTAVTQSLAVTDSEIQELGLTHLVNRSYRQSSPRVWLPPTRDAIGQDDFVPLSTFLMAA